MLDDKYQKIKLSTNGIYKERGSKFVAYSYAIYSEEEVKRLEYAAKYHCCAYVLDSDKSVQRANDDGEPSSTAGKPILGQISSNDLTNILIVAVKYFGGIKLGVPALIRSYKTAAADAISKSNNYNKSHKKTI